MLGNIVIGVPTMEVCLLLQSVLVVAALRYYMSRVLKGGAHDIDWGWLCRVNGAMTLLRSATSRRSSSGRSCSASWGSSTSWKSAVYPSGVNFATLGYGDIVMSEHRRLLGPIEVINGALMIGVASALLMTVLQHLFKRRGLGE